MNIWDCEEARLIYLFYGDTQAKRSKVFYIKHITESVEILKALGAPHCAMRAFMIHPIIQSDHDMDVNWRALDKCSPLSCTLAVEYRAIANGYLNTDLAKEIRLSPVSHIQQMLVADKVQNFKDFLRYHIAPRHDEIKCYFLNWLEALKPWMNGKSVTELMAVADGAPDPVWVMMTNPWVDRPAPLSPVMPKFRHDCMTCKFLGHHDACDLYWCPQGNMPTVIARYGDVGSQYKSGLIFKHDKDLVTAKRLAKERGFEVGQ